MSDLEGGVAAMLAALGADRPDMADTPQRVAELWRENLLLGEQLDPAEALADTLPDTSGAVVTLTDIPFHSLCPHHLTPTLGVVHLAYEPDGVIVGLGALEKLVVACSRRFVLQEELTAHLVDALMAHLGARGAACAIEGQHLCLVLRGREPRAARVVTRLAKGSLEGRPEVLPPTR